MKVDKSSSLVKELLEKREQERAERQKGENKGAAARIGSDRVQFGIGRELSAQLSPERLAAERAEKIERIKQQVQEGGYRVPSQELARAVGEEISMSILEANETSE